MKDIFSAKSSHVKWDPKSNVCLLQQPASKQDISTQYQGKQQVCASQRVLQHQGASCAAPQKQGRTAGHNARESQRKNRDVIHGNEDLEDLIESIPHHDQIMHSIQEMYPSGMVVTY